MSRTSLPALLVLCVLPATGCVETGLKNWAEPFDYAPIEADAPPVSAPEPRTVPDSGAIWNGQTASGSFLFFDEKARGLGDLVTIVIDEAMQAEGSALTDTERTSSIGATASSDLGIAELFTKPFSELAELLGADTVDPAVGADISAIQAQNSNVFEGEGSTQRSGRFTGVVTCRIVNVLPGKVFHVRGRRSLVVNHEEQFLTVEGLVRQEDIGINNTVLSSALAEARLTLDGVGVIDDKQRPGLIARVLDWVYPF